MTFTLGQYYYIICKYFHQQLMLKALVPRLLGESGIPVFLSGKETQLNYYKRGNLVTI